MCIPYFQLGYISWSDGSWDNCTSEFSRQTDCRRHNTSGLVCCHMWWQWLPICRYEWLGVQCSQEGQCCLLTLMWRSKWCAAVCRFLDVPVVCVFLFSCRPMEEDNWPSSWQCSATQKRHSSSHCVLILLHCCLCKLCAQTELSIIHCLAATAFHSDIIHLIFYRVQGISDNEAEETRN